MKRDMFSATLSPNSRARDASKVQLYAYDRCHALATPVKPPGTLQPRFIQVTTRQNMSLVNVGCDSITYRPPLRQKLLNVFGDCRSATHTSIKNQCRSTNANATRSGRDALATSFCCRIMASSQLYRSSDTRQCSARYQRNFPRTCDDRCRWAALFEIHQEMVRNR